MKESEGKEMKKDIEWLKREIPNVRGYAVLIDEIDGGLNPVTTISLKDVYRLINQLDEPEVTHEQVVEWIENNEFYCHATAETVLENAVDKGELGYYGTKYSVVEKSVIPKFVAEYLEFAKNDVPLMRILEIANTRDEWPNLKREYDWIATNDEVFARAWLDGYEVEEEPLYYALIKGHELIAGEDACKYWKCDMRNGSVFLSNRYSHYGRYLAEMSKNDWGKFDINDTNADFVRVDD